VVSHEISGEAGFVAKKLPAKKTKISPHITHPFFGAPSLLGEVRREAHRSESGQAHDPRGLGRSREISSKQNPAYGELERGPFFLIALRAAERATRIALSSGGVCALARSGFPMSAGLRFAA